MSNTAIVAPHAELLANVTAWAGALETLPLEEISAANLQAVGDAFVEADPTLGAGLQNRIASLIQALAQKGSDPNEIRKALRVLALALQVFIPNLDSKQLAQVARRFSDTGFAYTKTSTREALFLISKRAIVDKDPNGWREIQQIAESNSPLSRAADFLTRYRGALRKIGSAKNRLELVKEATRFLYEYRKQLAQKLLSQDLSLETLMEEAKMAYDCLGPLMDFLWDNLPASQDEIQEETLMAEGVNLQLISLDQLPSYRDLPHLKSALLGLHILRDHIMYKPHFDAALGDPEVVGKEITRLILETSFLSLFEMSQKGFPIFVQTSSARFPITLPLDILAEGIKNLLSQMMEGRIPTEKNYILIAISSDDETIFMVSPEWNSQTFQRPKGFEAIQTRLEEAGWSLKLVVDKETNQVRFDFKPLPIWDRKLAEGNVEASKNALGRIAARVLLDEISSWKKGLGQIASGPSEMAVVAKGIFKMWAKLQPLAEAKNRFQLATLGEKLFKEEYKRVIRGLLDGSLRFSSKLGQRLNCFSQGIGSLIDALDDRGTEKLPDWGMNDIEASKLFHDGIGRMQLAFMMSAEILLQEERSQEDFLYLTRYLSGSENEDELLLVVRSSLLNNCLGIAAKRIRVVIDVPIGIKILKNLKQIEILNAALIELVHNAVKCADMSKPSPTIRIHWDKKGQRLIVEDNGVGIRDTQAVFEGKREHPEMEEGTGQGLGFHRKSLEEIGWRLEAQSTPGVQTQFILTPPPSPVISKSEQK